MTPGPIIVYAIARSGTAIPIGMASWREGHRLAPALLQGGSDLAAAAALLALAAPGLRALVGGWWVFLFLYMAIWESLQFRRRLAEIMDPPIDDEFGAVESAVRGWGSLALLAWQSLGVAPPIAAIFLLAFDAVAPHEITFPVM